MSLAEAATGDVTAGGVLALNLNNTPPWLLGVILAVVLPLAVEVGYRLHTFFAKGEIREREETGAGHIVSAALALLGLLIAFTFAMAADRYETRRQLVMNEANAIALVREVQQLFIEPERSQVDALMKTYVKLRLEFVAAGEDEARLNANSAETRIVQQQIWTHTANALRAPDAGPVTSTVVLPATAQMFAIAATRREALEATVPRAILWALIVYATVSAVLMGYGLATTARRHVPGSVALFLLVALTIALTLDLDQPRIGSIRISQAPMQRVAAEVLGTRVALDAD
jgi:hypothetical protein